MAGYPTKCKEYGLYDPSRDHRLNYLPAMATVQSDIFQPTKFGGKYTSTLIPGEQLSLIPPSEVEAADL